MAQLLEAASEKSTRTGNEIPEPFGGAILGGYGTRTGVINAAGNIARFLGTLLTPRHPDHFDVKVRHLEEKKALWSNFHGFSTPHSKCKDSPAKYPFRGRRRTGYWSRLAEAQDVSWVDPVDYARYKILAHFPGGTTAVYSRNLNHLWARARPS